MTADLTQITDHTLAAGARVREYMKGKPNFAALLNAVVGQIQDLENAAFAVLTERTIDTAVGVQLAAIGKVVGQPRAGETDALYRRKIRARIATNNSEGTIDEIYNIARLIVDDSTVSLILHNYGTAAFHLVMFSAPVTDAVATIVSEFLAAAKTAGVRAIVESQGDVDAEMFTFARNTFMVGAHIGGGTVITVDSTAGFADTGTLRLAPGLLVDDNVTYSGKTPTTFTGINGGGGLPYNFDDRAQVQAVDAALGKGWGDFAAPTVGGKLASAKEG